MLRWALSGAEDVAHLAGTMWAVSRNDGSYPWETPAPASSRGSRAAVQPHPAEPVGPPQGRSEALAQSAFPVSVRRANCSI